MFRDKMNISVFSQQHTGGMMKHGFLIKIFCTLLAGVLVLTGCAGQQSEPQAAVQDTQAPQTVDNQVEPVTTEAPTQAPTPEPTEEPTPVPTDTPAPTDTPTPAPTREPEEGDVCANFPDYDTGVDADYSYQSDELRIAIKKVVDEENVLTYFVADIWLRNYRSFRTAFGNGDFNSGTESADSMCQRERAVLGITGSYNNGLTLHNGVRYKGISRELTREICVIYRDGKMKTMDYSAAKFNDKKAVENGAWQAWQFGPIFISDGVAKDGYKENATRHPRCMLGYYEPGHYVLVLVDGRQGKEGYSIGMNYYEQVELMKSLGCVEAYNLDGGESVRMVFMGEIINHPSGDRDGDGVADRNLLDMLVFAEYDLEGNAPSYEEVADKVTIRTTVE